LLSSFPNDEFSEVTRGGGSLLLAQPVLLILLLPALAPSDSSLLRVRRLFLFAPLHGTGDRLGLGLRWIRSCGVHDHPLLKDNYQDRTGVSQENEEEEGSLLTTGASGSITNDPRALLPYRTALRLMARLALVAAYSGGRRSCSSRKRANAIGLATSLIS
jgi:hypothetical protein